MLIPFISASKISNEAWITLLKAYATPSRVRIQQYRRHLNNPKLGNRTITDYMHEIKGNIDALALMNVIVDFDELSVRILDGLDSRYEGLANAIHAREQPITFDELLEKLLNHEANLKATPTPANVTSPVTVMAAPVRPNPRNQNRGGGGSHQFRQQSRSSASPTGPSWSPRPLLAQSWSPCPPSRPLTPGARGGYLGKCQICRQQGHSATQCSLYIAAPWQQCGPPLALLPPTAHTVSHPSSASPYDDWILDSGASHHVTTDLANPSLHSPYTAGDNVVIGDGSGLPISNIGSLSLPTSTFPLQLLNVLHVPTMKMNLISVSMRCATNNIDVVFFNTFFQVQDRRTGTIMIWGHRRNGLYY